MSAERYLSLAEFQKHERLIIGGPDTDLDYYESSLSDLSSSFFSKSFPIQRQENYRLKRIKGSSEAVVIPQ